MSYKSRYWLEQMKKVFGDDPKLWPSKRPELFQLRRMEREKRVLERQKQMAAFTTVRGITSSEGQIQNLPKEQGTDYFLNEVVFFDTKKDPMQQKLYTLRALLKKKRKTDLKVQSANGTVAVIIGLSKLPNETEEKAYGYLLRSSNDAWQSTDISKMETFDADREHWKLWKAPKDVPYWPAIRKVSRGQFGRGYAITGVLYATDAQAKAGLKGDFIRLAKHLKPIYLPECEND